MESSKINPVSAYFLTINSASTIQSSIFRLRSFCQFTFNEVDFNQCDWNGLSYINVLSYMQHQRESGLAYSSINVTLSILKSVALQAWQLSVINIDEYMRIKTTKGLRGARVDAGRSLSVNEIQNIKKKCTSSDDKTAKRNFAIFALGCGAGLRRIELSRLDIENIHDDKLQVIGKGNKERVVYLNPFTQKAVKNWLDVRDSDSGALFVRIFANNKVGKRIGVLSIHRAIEKIQINSRADRFTTHDLRRTFATMLLDANADKFAVQRLLGHSSLNTTERYDKRGDRAAKAAIELLPF